MELLIFVGEFYIVLLNLKFVDYLKKWFYEILFLFLYKIWCYFVKEIWNMI